MSRMQEVKKELAILGMTITRKAFESEIRVNFKGGEESTAYYTTDLEDACNTAKKMWERKQFLAQVMMEGL